ncbi:MAG: hypothetical protein WC374_13045 [Phycisphaerae bacterium]|jgi:hypothetical protein
MNKESKAQLLEQVKKQLEQVWDKTTIDIDLVEKQYDAINNARGILKDYNNNIIFLYVEDIHLQSTGFYPLISAKTDNEIKVNNERVGEYIEVRVKGNKYEWFCLIKKNWFMAGA